MAKVLIVEDEHIISEPFSIVLKSQNHDVDVAHDGKQALRLCKDKTYDLILLDIMMPVLNGVEFLRKASLSANSPKTKVILMTNLGTGEEINEAVKLGAKKGMLKAELTPSLLAEMVKEEATA